MNNPDTPNNTDITTLYIVRHGESLDNAGIPYPRTPEGSPLTERGQEQAHDVGRRLSDVPVDVIIASDLIRARQTAEIIAEEIGAAWGEQPPEVLVIPELQERTVGSFGGRTDLRELEEYRERFEEYERGTHEDRMRWKLGEEWESLEEAQRRFVGALERIVDDYPHRTAIVVAHGTVIKTFLIYIGFGTLETLTEDLIENTGYIVVETDGKRFTLKQAFGIREKAAATAGRLEQ